MGIWVYELGLMNAYRDYSSKGSVYGRLQTT